MGPGLPSLCQGVALFFLPHLQNGHDTNTLLLAVRAEDACKKAWQVLGTESTPESVCCASRSPRAADWVKG